MYISSVNPRLWFLTLTQYSTRQVMKRGTGSYSDTPYSDTPYSDKCFWKGATNTNPIPNPNLNPIPNHNPNSNPNPNPLHYPFRNVGIGSVGIRTASPPWKDRVHWQGSIGQDIPNPNI